MRLAYLIISATLLCSGMAQAASPMVEAYKAYMAALETGDIITADVEGEKAWQAAEQAKNERYSAILAYNLAELRVRYLPDADAAKPANRAFSLTKSSSKPALALQSTRVLKSLTDFMSRQDKNTRRALKWSLKAFDTAELDMIYPVFRAHFELMRDASSQRYWRLTREQSKAAEEAYKIMDMDEPSSLASLKLFDVAAMLIQSDFKGTDEAQEELQAIFDALGPQPYDRPNQLILTARAWTLAANAMQRSRNTITKKLIDVTIPPATGRPENCPKMEWIHRTAPEYPQNLAQKGYVGAALVQFTIGEDGIPKDIEVAAEVPMPMFGKYAEEVVPTWRAEPMSGVPAECREFIQTPFIFQTRK